MQQPQIKDVDVIKDQIKDAHQPQLHGFYLGKVLKHLPYGKIKVWIPGVFEDKYQDPGKWKELPDCVQLSPIFGGVYQGNGMFSYPNIKSTVMCLFINGDQNYPAYFASVLTGEKDGTWQQWDQIFPGWADQLESHIHTINIGQNFITFHEDGSITLQSWNKTDGGFSKVMMSKDGDISIKSTKQLDIEAPTINITASDQIMMKSPRFTNVSGVRNTTVCDMIELNAIGGQVNVKSWMHPTGQSF